MSRDHIVRALLPEHDLRVLVAFATGVSQHAASIHRCEPTAAMVLSQILTGAALVGGLGKGEQRVTLQLEGNGPLKGMFAEGSAEGNLRAYVRAERVDFPGRDPSNLEYSIGPEGYVSVLRELPTGEFYRGSVGLDFQRLDRNLERYFEASDQVPTAVAIEVEADEARMPSRAVGLLVQRLPGGDDAALATIVERLRDGALRRELGRTDRGGTQLALPVLEGFGPLDVLEDIPLSYRCTCSRERAERGVIAAGEDEILSMVATDKGAELSCEFCKTVYRFTAEELLGLLDSMRPGGEG
ncbi:Hsp33 family molecular chaperone HslO [Vulgatibacter incomptus]|uniref:33 kDa chaperonin n=1 Tax=Vulgatibacter incomptus TaxID=1391653 RepID=A0A0K1P999_9BACT|nr:Hsp33 family molecular chaperone HslO [Vulgatibacter incomptus]AKU89679.1 33 kDa chaperonin [Vulgatibacter incomptus]